MQKIREAQSGDLEEMLRIWQASLDANTRERRGDFRDLAVKRFKENFHTLTPPFTYRVATSPQLVGWSSLLPAFTNPIKSATHAEVSVYTDPVGAPLGTGLDLLVDTLSYAASGGFTEVWGFIPSHQKDIVRMCEIAGMKVCGKTASKIIMHVQQDVR